MVNVRANVSVIVLAATLIAPSGLAAQTREAIVPFKIAIPDAVLTDLKDRLAKTRFPSEIEGSGWD